MRLGCSLFVLLVGCGQLASDPQCQTQALAALSDYDSFDALVAHGSNVLWTDKDGLWSMPKEGGAPTKLATCTSSFAVDGEIAFCKSSQSSSVMRVPLDGSGAIVLATNVDASIVAAENERVFVDDGSTLSTIDEVTGAIAPLVSAPWLFARVVDGGFVYWSSTAAGPQTTVNATSTTTGETTPLATLNIVVHFVAVNSTSLFVSGYDPNDPNAPADTNFQMPKNGGTPHVFLTAAQDVFAVDDTTLFAATSDGLVAYPLDGGTPTKLAAGPFVSLMAIDGSYVYWAANVEHAATLLRVCR